MPNSITNEEVKSAGNSWIICRSKTYLDRIYYFNTLTGEAVWNLSEAEMEKAKNATKNFAKSNSVSIDNCPEPMGSPSDNDKAVPNKEKLSQNAPTNICNNLNINNQHSKAVYYPSVNPMQFGIAVPSMYNPLNWNVPPQPVIITPIVKSQDQAVYAFSPNTSSCIPVSSTKVPLSSRFKSFNELENSKSPPVLKKVLPEFTDEGYNLLNAQNSNRNSKMFGNKQDLREILSAKRERRDSTSSGTYEHRGINAHNKKSLLDMRDEEWLVEKLQSNPHYNIYTSALRELLNVANNSGLLYIITDTNILKNNTNFLKVLLHSDKECNLILPRAVVDELDSVAETNPQAASYFITQQGALSQVVIDEERLGQDLFCIQDEILGCCARLSEQGCSVILITNNIQILILKEKVDYKILTMREVKTLVCRPRTEVTYYLPLNDTKRSIKITIPNESNDTTSYTDENNCYSANEVKNDSEQIICGSSNIVGEKRTSLDEERRKNASFRIQSLDNETQDTANTEEIANNSTEETKNNTQKIKLKRRMSYDSSKSLPNGTVNFKGHRKKERGERNMSESCTAEINEFSSQSDSNDFGETQNECNPNDSLTNEIVNEIKVLKDSEPPLNDSNISEQSLKSLLKEDKNVMFEITSKAMEENLNIKCDEWVSRFTQIMEEALTQVLNREPKFVCEAMLPPWSLYEATECTRKKFHYDSDIVDAANKLRNILFDIGGSRGKVKLNIRPEQYMEVYSYGVYLIDSLQAEINECEDIQIAGESLYKLLSDIQDPNLDYRNQNMIANVANKEIKNTTINLEDNTKKTEEKIPLLSSQVVELEQDVKKTLVTTPVKCKAYKLKKTLNSPSTYRLRSTIKNTVRNLDYDTNTQNTTDSESSFFKSLQLTKNNTVNVEVSETQEPNAQDNLKSNNHNEVDYGTVVNESAEESDEMFHTCTNIDQDKSIEPKIVRNFVTCLDFEERIKNNKALMHNCDPSFAQDDDLDYFEDPYPNYDDTEINECDENVMDGTYEIGNEDFYPENEEEYEEVNDMNCFIDNIITESNEVFGLVRNFCEKSYDFLQEPNIESDKSEILREADELNESICNICDTLDSILQRESTYSKNSIGSVSTNPALNLAEMTVEEVQNYRKVIAKCLEQGNILKESVTLIIDAIKH